MFLGRKEIGFFPKLQKNPFETLKNLSSNGTEVFYIKYPKTRNLNN